jgi:hypothetical protein
MRESCKYGSVRGARGNSRPYRDTDQCRLMAVRREKVARRLRVGASPTEKSSRDWLGWLQDRQIGGLRAFENPSDIDASL